jgi:hypothetical protein
MIHQQPEDKTMKATKIHAGLYQYRGHEIEKIWTEWCGAWEWAVYDSRTGNWCETWGSLWMAKQAIDESLDRTL